jgi:hypothetical protein
MKKPLLIALFSILGLLVYCQEFTTPLFTLMSGEDKALDSFYLQGKVTLCFYESNETKDKNKKLKEELKSIIGSMSVEEKREIFVLAVADCSKAKKPFTVFWKKALEKQSKEIGYTLYGDWTGQMRDIYLFIIDESNFAIFDKKGQIRFQRKDVIPNSDYQNIKDILITLTNE